MAVTRALGFLYLLHAQLAARHFRNSIRQSSSQADAIRASVVLPGSPTGNNTTDVEWFDARDYNATEAAERQLGMGGPFSGWKDYLPDGSTWADWLPGMLTSQKPSSAYATLMLSRAMFTELVRSKLEIGGDGKLHLDDFEAVVGPLKECCTGVWFEWRNIKLSAFSNKRLFKMLGLEPKVSVRGKLHLTGSGLEVSDAEISPPGGAWKSQLVHNSLSWLFKAGRANAFLSAKFPRSLSACVDGSWDITLPHLMATRGNSLVLGVVLKHKGFEARQVDPELMLASADTFDYLTRRDEAAVGLHFSANLPSVLAGDSLVGKGAEALMSPAAALNSLLSKWRRSSNWLAYAMLRTLGMAWFRSVPELTSVTKPLKFHLKNKEAVDGFFFKEGVPTASLNEFIPILGDINEALEQDDTNRNFHDAAEFEWDLDAVHAPDPEPPKVVFEHCAPL